jgi:hypothetical protein
MGFSKRMKAVYFEKVVYLWTLPGEKAILWHPLADGD